MDQDELVECYMAYSLMEAKFIADQLNAEGIRARSDQQDLQDFMGTWQGNPRIYVLSSDLPRAKAWLAAYDENHKKRVEEEALREQEKKD
ncbi:hypothetical protein BH23PLA1_BH23PLA1_19220 [soil metagenome]